MRLPRLLCTAVLCTALSLGAALPSPAAEKKVVYFGVNLRYDPIVMYERYQPMMDYLTRNTPYRFELKISQNYQEGIRFLMEGKTQLASLGDGAVMEAMDKGAALPILKPINAQGKPLYRTLFVAPLHSPIRTLKELKGKRIALGYHHSLTGNLFARRALRENGMGTGDFAALSSLRNHSSVAKAVLKGEFDAGALKDVVAGMYLPRGLKVIGSSQEYPSTPLVASPATPAPLIDAVRRALMKLDGRNPEHRRMLAHWDEEYRYGFVAASAAEYREVARLFRKVPYGCGGQCHR